MNVTQNHSAPRLKTGSGTPSELDPHAWKSTLAADARTTFTRGRWPYALMAIGWVHLGFFAIEQAIWNPKEYSDWRYPLLWLLELVTILVVLRKVAGRGWLYTSPAVALVTRFWATFLILSFNLSTLNAFTGWSMNWYKPVWATLSTFLFASLAWLFQPKFLFLAVQMYFTGLLMVKFPHWDYLIYGLSWWAALQAIGLSLLKSRRTV
jgi:hypothetical protein